MLFKNRYQVVVKVFDTVVPTIYLEFARAIDTDVLEDISQLLLSYGKQINKTFNSYIIFPIPLNYDCIEIAKELKEIFNKHQFNNIKFIVNSSSRTEKEI